ncbi:MAG TPA: hypothetical protein VFE33_03105 [Thermoanaerobaculia bacterium]|nr:hypothetical protein [Thermoanaerobaculia bacterium]
MRKKSQKKITLSRETLRQLDEGRLPAAIAGAETDSCAGTCACPDTHTRCSICCQ